MDHRDMEHERAAWLEIDLLGEVMIAAAGAPGQLSVDQVDLTLGLVAVG